MRSLAYEISSTPTEVSAVAACAKCGKNGHVKMPHTSRHNPEAIANLFRREGWDFEPTSPRKCRCPEHARNPGSKPKKVEQMTSKLATIARETQPPRAAPAPVNASEIFRDLKPGSATVAPNQSEPSAAETITSAIERSATTIRELSPGTKTRIRTLLDGHFDDTRGAYLDGYSDQRIGNEVGVPWACVTQMREAAYGPIRIDPEVEVLKGLLADAKTHVTKLTSEQEAAEALVKALGREIKKAVSDLERLSSRVEALSQTRKA